MNEKITEKYIRAVKISMEMWKWLMENPGNHKYNWPKYDEYKIYLLPGQCPLCVCHEYLHKNCILQENCEGVCCGDYYAWADSLDKKYAECIYNKIKKEYDRITA